MPSVLHEAIVSMFTSDPQLTIELWQSAGLGQLPDYDTLQGDKINLSQETTAAYDADGVALLNSAGTPQLALIVEVQLEVKEAKLYSWPGYVASARFKKRCDAEVLVITPYARVARWARQPIRLGRNSWVTPIVFGPEEIPVISDPEFAKARPEMMLLSAITHGKGPNANDIAVAAAAMVSSLDEDKHDLYNDLVFAHLSRRAKEAFQDMFKHPKITEPFSDEYKTVVAEAAARAADKARAEARAEAKVEAEAAAKAAARRSRIEMQRETLKKQMRFKFRALSEDHVRFIDAADADTLDGALERILSADTPEGVLHS